MGPGLIFLGALYAALFVVAPLLSGKIAALPFGLSLPVGALAVAVAYSALDAAHDVFGRPAARAIVLSAAGVRAFVYAVFVPLALFLPTASALEGYERLFGESVRMLVAAEVAMVVSQLFVDIPIFAALRRELPVPFAVRYVASTVLSNLVSTVAFAVIAFAGSGRASIVSIVGGMLATRFTIVLLLVPVASLLRRIGARFAVVAALALVALAGAPAGAQSVRLGLGSTFTERGGAVPHLGLFVETGEVGRLSANAVARFDETGTATYLAKASLRVARGLKLEAGVDFLPRRDYDPEPVVGVVLAVPIAKRISAVGILNAEPLEDWGWAAIFRVNVTLWSRRDRG